MILVTGATGTIGTELCQALRRDGVQFCALARSEQQAARFEARGVPARRGDFDEPGTLGAAFEGVETLFLLTPSTETQGETQARAIAEARGAGVSRIVKLSAWGTSPDSPLTLCRQHALAEQALRQSGMGWSIMRPASFMQNLLYSRESITGKGEFYGCSGDGAMAFIDARDIAEAAAVSLQNKAHDGNVYQLTGPEAISNEAVAALLSDSLGIAVRYVDLPEETYRGGMVAAGVPRWLADDMVMSERLFRGGSQPVSLDADNLLGRAPRSFGAFAADYAAAFFAED